MTIDLDKLEHLHATATPGLWDWVPAFGPTAIYGSTAGPGEFVAEGVSPADTRFIVEARNQLPALIAELREARAVIERVRVLADDLDRRGCLSCSSLTGGDDLAVELREALDGARD